MKKRPVVHAAVAFLLGNLCVLSKGTAVGGAVLFLIIDLIQLQTLRWNKIKTYLFFALLLTAFITGAVRTWQVNADWERICHALEQTERISFEGRLYQKEVKNDKTIYYLKNVWTRSGKLGKIVCYPNEDRYPVGSRLGGSGRILEMHEAANEGGFDERSYYRALGFTVKVAEEQLVLLKKPAVPVGEWLYDLRVAIRQFYEDALYGEEAGLLAMMTIGDRGTVDDEAKELFSEAGLSHIFAISGLHISLVGLGLFGFLRKRRCSYATASAVSAVMVILYAQMVGASVSTIRAVGMFFILLLAKTEGEAYDRLTALAVMAVVILIGNPLAVGQASFVFSFGAVTGLTVIVTPVADLYKRYCVMRWEQAHKRGQGSRWHIRPRERLCSALLWGATMQMVTIPLAAYYFYSVPLYVIFLNLLLLPFLGLLLGLGLSAGLLGCVAPVIGQWLLLPCHFLLYFYEWMAHLSLQLPCAQWIVGKPSYFQMIIYYIGIYFLYYRAKKWMEKVEEAHEQAMRLVSGRTAHQKPVPGGWHRVAVTVAGCGLLLLLLQAHPDRSFEVVMLSVGQGDGIFIDSGMGERYFIDGGSTSETELAKYTLLPFLKSRGIRQIDAWFLTHMDLDHISGFMEAVQDGYRVGSLFLAESLERTQKYEEIVELCRQRHIVIRYIKTGDRLVCSGGLVHKRRLTWECLAPDVPSAFSGANENSLVLHLAYSDEGKRKDGRTFDGIFTGDIGEEQERAIIANSPEQWAEKSCMDGKVELLKSAHHGSNGSNCTEWLGEPEFTIISAGKRNRYGHPGKEAIARMDALGLPHVCTIDAGQIRVRWKDGMLVVEQYADNAPKT